MHFILPKSIIENSWSVAEDTVELIFGPLYWWVVCSDSCEAPPPPPSLLGAEVGKISGAPAVEERKRKLEAIATLLLIIDTSLSL